MQVCTSLQTDNHASTSLLKFFTGWMPFLPPDQQRQSTEGKTCETIDVKTNQPAAAVADEQKRSDVKAGAEAGDTSWEPCE